MLPIFTEMSSVMSGHAWLDCVIQMLQVQFELSDNIGHLLYTAWRSFVKKLHSLPCIREISWENARFGKFGCYLSRVTPDIIWTH